MGATLISRNSRWKIESAEFAEALSGRVAFEGKQLIVSVAGWAFMLTALFSA